MEIWLDTVELETIERAKQMGVLFGVTTNPTLIAESKQPTEDLLYQLLQVQKGPVTAQVTAKEAPQMFQQGEALHHFSNRILTKIPVTAEGLKAMHALTQRGIPVMATAVFDLNQVLLAAAAGATYIAPYFSPICEADLEGPEQFKEMFHLLERYKFRSKLLAASLKSADQVRQCVAMGIPAATLKKEVFLSLIQDHPETIKRVERFSKDWEGVKRKKGSLL